MLPAPSPRSMVSSNGCVMPGMPAVPQNSAYTDQPNAASVPIEISVSIVAVPCRRLAHAARWNGQRTPHDDRRGQRRARATASRRTASAGTIAIAITGTVSTAETSSRWRQAWLGSSVDRGPRRRRRRGQRRGVPGAARRSDSCVGATPSSGSDLRLLGGVVHRRGDTVELVQLALDPVGARRTGHPGDGQLDGGVGHWWCSAHRAETELSGAHHAVVLEVEIEVVSAVAGHLGAERDVRSRLGLLVAGLTVGVDVQVGEVACPQRDQVSVGAEVGLQVGDRTAVLRDLQPEHRVLAGDEVPGQGHRVAVDLRDASVPVLWGTGHAAGDGEVRPERDGLRRRWA